MDFYVPTIGDKIYLEEDWTFDLYYEHRNDKLLLSTGVGETTTVDYFRSGPKEVVDYSGGKHGTVAGKCTLPRGTELKVARIYIRGIAHRMREFDSITFTITSCPNKKIKGRFWVKLRDANRIVCDLHPIVDTEARERFSRFSKLET
jgi:hypothetical protein